MPKEHPLEKIRRELTGTKLAAREAKIIAMVHGVSPHPAEDLPFMDEELADRGNVDAGAHVREIEADVIRKFRETGTIVQDNDGALRRPRSDEMN
ncbi:MAG: hypothetical protein WC604_04905 [Candidatus Gracilibacteria bacterium]